jgi:hypothetical protein
MPPGQHQKFDVLFLRGLKRPLRLRHHLPKFGQELIPARQKRLAVGAFSEANVSLNQFAEQVVVDEVA